MNECMNVLSLSSLISPRVLTTRETKAERKEGICMLCALKKEGYRAIEVMKELDLFTRYGDVELYGDVICDDCFRILRERLEITNLEPRVYHMLFTGGNLEQVSKGQGELDIALRRKISELIPPIAMLGTSYLNQSIPGKLIVGKAYPICKELVHFFKEYDRDAFDEEKLLYVEQVTDGLFQTRMDSHDVDVVDSENPIQMKVETEVFIPGVAFMHYFVLSHFTDVEYSMFRHMIELWKQKPFIGGKSAMGNGQIRIDYDPSSFPSPSLYLQFLDDNKEAIKGLIKEIELDGVNKTEKKSSKKSKNQSLFEEENNDA